MNVTFDAKSLLVDGRRVFVRGGAFHYFRLPAPGLWRDRLLKIKRAGYNAVDLYFPWSYHSDAPGRYDFSGVRDVDYLLGLVEETGLYLIARPSPFVNAELSGGGIPTWLLRRHDVPLRCRVEGGLAHCDSPEYLRYVREWQENIVPRIARRANLLLFQIENEYVNDDLRPDYMRFLYDLARELGVRVPIFHNDMSNMGAWADVAEIYAVDSYPITDFSSDWRGRPEAFQMLDNVGMIYENFAPASPRFVAELQGGWFDAWTGVGYDRKRQMLGPESMNTITWSVVAQGCTLYNHFMFVGGTNWDRIGAPCVQTSYDFATAVHEWGGISERYTAAKQIAHQIGAVEEWLCETEPADDVTAEQPDLLYRVLGAGKARFCFLRNLSMEPRATALTIEGRPVPPVEVAPGDTRLIVFHLQKGPVRISYASAPIFAWLEGEGEHELCFTGAGVAAWRTRHEPEMLQDTAGAWWNGERVLVAYDGAAPAGLLFRLAPEDGGVLVRAHFLPDASRAWLVDGRLVLGPEYAGEVRGGRLETYEEVGVEAAGLPPLRWSVRRDDAFLDLADRDDGWQSIPAGAPTDMDSLGSDGGIMVYRGRFDGPLAAVSLAPRHNGALYLDGRFVARLDEGYAAHPTEGELEEEPAPPMVRVALDAGPGPHALTVVVESLGYNKGFTLNERFPRGLLAWQTEPPTEVAWSARAGFPGEEEYSGADLEDSGWTPAPDLAAAPGEVAWARARFRLDLPVDLVAPVGLVLDGAADKAHIYLNGVLIARHWSVCAQHKYYLPEGVLDQHGENVLALALWRRGGAPAAGDVRLEAYGAWRVSK